MDNKPTIAEVQDWVLKLYNTCEQTITDEERKEQHKYAVMVQRPQDKKFLVQMLDESSQIRDRKKLAARIKTLIDRYGVPQFLGKQDAFLFKMYQAFGHHFDFIAIPIIKKRLRMDTSKVILNEARPKLTEHLSTRFKQKIGQNVNLLGEVVLGNNEADHRYHHYLEALANLPSLTISYNMWGSSPVVVEQNVTSKFEGVMNRIEGVSSVSSYSGKGYGSVTITFDKSADADMIRFEASSAIKQLWPELPGNVTYPSIRMNRPDDNKDAEKPLLSYTMIAPMDPDDIMKILEDKIQPPISLINGVSSVKLNGGNDKEWIIEYKRAIWEKYGITPADIGNAIRLNFSESDPQLASEYDEDGNERTIRLGFIQNQEKIFEPENIIVKNIGGHKIGRAHV